MRKAYRGATLIELSLVITIVSALLAITIPRAAGFLDAIAVRGAVTEIESLFSIARHAAISRGAQSKLLIDPTAGEITVAVGVELIRKRGVGEAHGVTLSTNRTSMTYSPIGVGYGAANFSLVISRNAVTDTIIISRLGRIRH